MLEQWQRIWTGESFGFAGEIGPRARPELIIGGASDAAIARAATYADGWVFGGGRPNQFGETAAKVKAAWRSGAAPRTLSLAYFALGPGARETANASLGDYYAFLGDEVAGMIAGGAATDADTVRAYVAGFADAGCDELILFPSSADPEQVDLLADAAL
jgi:alkanesulfonate monooxygenase SsuD/methylene tetrahydromethanopterin reductase-like flavin-dependent oxidoreductase (luciferase family)